MALWTPAEIATELWLDAQDYSTLTLSTSNVDQWDDKSGNDRHAVKNSSPAPVYSATSFLGAPGITASGNYLYVAPFGSGTYSIFIVTYTPSSSGSICQIGGGNTYFPIGQSGSTSENIIRVDGSDDPAGAVVLYNGEATQSVVTRDDCHDIVAGASGCLGEYINVPVTANNITIGIGGTWYVGGPVGEVIIVDGTPSDITRKKIEGYLAHKWELESLLPSDHPYKSSAPADDTYIAKSFVVDMLDNWGDASYVGYRSIELKRGGVVQNPAYTAMTGYDNSASFDPIHAFKNDVVKTGGSTTTNGWTSENGTVASTRTVVVFDTEVYFDEVVINNYHHNGGSITRGAKNIKITISTDSITSTTYDEAVSNSTLIFDGQILAHSATNTIDDQIVELIQLTEEEPVTIDVAVGLEDNITIAKLMTGVISGTITRFSASVKRRILVYKRPIFNSIHAIGWSDPSTGEYSIPVRGGSKDDFVVICKGAADENDEIYSHIQPIED